MKNLLRATVLAAALLPGVAFAASVQVYPLMTSSHGGTANSTNLKSCITANSATQCDGGVPMFQIPDGSTYSVNVTPPPGYSYSMDQNCSGTAAGDIVCTVSYADGAPIVQPTPASVPQPVEPAPQAQTPAAPAQPSAVPSVPIPTGIPTPVTSEVSTATDTPVQTILKVVVVHDYATTSPEEASTSAAVEQLQAQVGVLQQIVQTLQDLIGKILNFLGI